MKNYKKNVFITGGAQGLGEAFVHHFLHEGSKVYFVDINDRKGIQLESELRDRYGRDRVYFGTCDVTNKTSCQDAFDQAVECLGHIDILINNAGLMDEVHWKRMVQVNLVGLIYMSRIGLKHMRRDNGGLGGTIINISSTAAIFPTPFMEVYGATKAGVVVFTRNVALSLGPVSTYGVRVAALCPSFTNTPMVQLNDSGDNWEDPSRPETYLASDFVRDIQKNVGLMSTDDVVRALQELLHNHEFTQGVVLSVTPAGTYVNYKKKPTNSRL